MLGLVEFIFDRNFLTMHCGGIKCLPNVDLEKAQLFRGDEDSLSTYSAGMQSNLMDDELVEDSDTELQDRLQENERNENGMLSDEDDDTELPYSESNHSQADREEEENDKDAVRERDSEERREDIDAASGDGTQHIEQEHGQDDEDREGEDEQHTGEEAESVVVVDVDSTANTNEEESARLLEDSGKGPDAGGDGEEGCRAAAVSLGEQRGRKPGRKSSIRTSTLVDPHVSNIGE